MPEQNKGTSAKDDFKDSKPFKELRAAITKLNAYLQLVESGVAEFSPTAPAISNANDAIRSVRFFNGVQSTNDEVAA
jgi:hypothetical protein